MIQYNSLNDLPIVLTVEQLMPILSIGRAAAYDLVRSQKLPSVRIGHQYRIYKEALIEFLSSSSGPVA